MVKGGFLNRLRPGSTRAQPKQTASFRSLGEPSLATRGSFPPRARRAVGGRPSASGCRWPDLSLPYTGISDRPVGRSGGRRLARALTVTSNCTTRVDSNATCPSWTGEGRTRAALGSKRTKGEKGRALAPRGTNMEAGRFRIEGHLPPYWPSAFHPACGAIPAGFPCALGVRVGECHLRL